MTQSTLMRKQKSTSAIKGMQDRGIQFSPNPERGFECYINADWAGNWNKNYADVPSCAYSQSGYMILYAGCPIVWDSKIQSLIALSTAEAKIIALSTA